MSRTTRHFVAATLAIGGALAVAAPASAFVDGDYNTTGVRIRASAPSGEIRGEGFPGQGVRLFCFVQSTTVQGNPFWDSTRNLTTGISGFSAEAFLNPHFPAIQHC